ncbi:MAG TPA: PAS domain-containing protein [Streptosporangiaceae bacterium]
MDQLPDPVPLRRSRLCVADELKTHRGALPRRVRAAYRWVGRQGDRMNVVLSAAAASPVFTHTAAPYLLLDTEFTIRAVNDSYLKATDRSVDDTVGRLVFDAFPDNPEDPAADGVRNLSASLCAVLSTCHAHEMQIQRYDVRPSDPHVQFRRKYWTPVNTPLLDENGHIGAILHHVEDVTAAVNVVYGQQLGEEQQDTVRAIAMTAVRLHATAASLQQRSTRLSDALTAMAAARPSARGHVTLSRRAHLGRALAAHVDDSPWLGWAHAACVSAVECLDTVDGAAIAVISDVGRLQPICATDQWAVDLQELEILCDGPSARAISAGLPVVADPMDGESERWPAYVAAASDFTAAAAYPLALLHLPLGVLTLYRRSAEIHPSHSEQLEAGLFAEFALAGVLADIYQSGSAIDCEPGRSRHHLAGLVDYLSQLRSGDTFADYEKT